MKWASYLPKSPEENLEWMKNFRTKVTLHAATLKLDPEEVIEILAAIDDIIDAGEKYFGSRTSFRSAKEDYQGKLHLITNRDGRLTRYVKTIKGKSAYTQAIGEDLGVVGHPIEIDYDLYIPKVRVIVLGLNNVELRFNRNYCDAVAVYGRRGEEEDFSLLGISTTKVFHDLRPNINPAKPEIRLYQIVLLKGDKEVSKPSDVASVKV